MHGSALRSFLIAAFLTTGMISLSASRGVGATCAQVVALMERGLSIDEISALTGVAWDEMQFCFNGGRVIISPVRPAPHGAAGPPPFGAAGPPPFGAAGPPPFGAAGPPPFGAAGPPPHGAAGPPPVGAAGPPPHGAAGGIGTW